MPTETLVRHPVTTNGTNGASGTPTRRRLRVAVLAEDVLTAQSLTALLERSPSIQAQAHSSVGEVARRLGTWPADAILWYAHEIDRGALARVNALREELGVAVCILADDIDPAGLREAYFSRAEGLAVVMRRTKPDVADVFRILVQLVTGRVVLSPAVLEQLVAEAPAAEQDALSSLTASELMVLELMSLGLRNSAIAERLGRSEKLVEKHVGRIFAKLGLKGAPSSELDRRVTAARTFLLARGPAGERLPQAA